MVKKFLRRTGNKLVKLGKGRPKKQVWRSPKGRDNKMREKRKGYAAVVSIGYGTKKQERGKIKGKNPVHVSNINDLIILKKDDLIIIKNVGKKKRMEIEKIAKEKGILIENKKKSEKIKSENKNELK